MVKYDTHICFPILGPMSVGLWLSHLILHICFTSLTRAKWNFPLNFRTMRKLSDLYSAIFQNSLTCAKWNFPLNFRTMRKLSDLYSATFQNSLTCAKWNFPLNFRTMRKLSDLYSGIFQTQSSGCASGVDLFRNFTKLKILNI